MAVPALVGTQSCAYPSMCDLKIGALCVHTSVHHTAFALLKMNPQKKLENNNAILKKRIISTNATASGNDSPNDDTDESNQPPDGKNSGNDEIDKFRKDLERIVSEDDSTFSGVELANLIRNKYGRSYDVTLIKKEFMGRSLLALNVMWKYREQRSFPLTEEEYLLRLDDVANNLKCWGAVSHVRNSLARLKERPRIGKAVSIFIDVEETGGRASEWIYR